MKILIGENIKRLRKEKKITQEALAEHFNVSTAAVSKWENDETYPDITLLFPLANYFGITIDELMGYDYLAITNEIEQVKTKIKQVWHVDNDYEKAKELVKTARQKYPNDYDIMDYYLFFLAGGLADNDNAVLIDNEEEIIKVCDLILAECHNEEYRLDAITYKAKVFLAKGLEEKALLLLNDFPSFYHTKGQRIEQLYPKNSPKFYQTLTSNLFELVKFIGNKLGKYIIYNQKLTNEEKINKTNKLLMLYQNLVNDDDYQIITLIINNAIKEIYHRSTMMDFDDDQINKLKIMINNII